MDSELPQWQPLDADEPEGSPLFAREDEDGSRVWALVFTEAVTAEGWAHRAAVALAEAWAGRSGRVLLADLDLADAPLHDIVDVENGEGVSDVFLYGASPQRVAHPLSRALLFAPAGTVVADPEAVMTSERWASVVDGFERAGASLVLYVPADAAGLGSLLEHATDVVLLSGPEEEVSLGSAAERVRAVHGPDPEAAAMAAAQEEVSSPGPGERRETDPVQDQEEWMEPEAEEAVSDASEVEDEEPENAPDPLEREEEIEQGEHPEPVAAGGVEGPEPAAGGSSRRRAVLLVVLLLVVLAAVVAAAWTGLVEIPGLSPLLSGVVPSGPEGIAGTALRA